ncbi:hypothetical protein MMC13_006270 [Lambiella insularis]|nr:hypothetical protein [Lambiella insularis]
MRLSSILPTVLTALLAAPSVLAYANPYAAADPYGADIYARDVYERDLDERDLYERDLYERDMYERDMYERDLYERKDSNCKICKGFPGGTGRNICEQQYCR